MEQRTCSVDGCFDTAYSSRGWCRSHLNLWRRYGDPLGPPDGFESLPGERWLPVVGFDGLYQVSDLGRIYSLRRPDSAGRVRAGRFMKLGTHKGYLVVGLFRNGRRERMAPVHRLVLEAFVGACPDGKEACHDNGDRADARLVNLRWDTRPENNRDQYRHGTRAHGIRHGMAKLTDEDVDEIRRRYWAGRVGSGPRITHRALAGEYGVSQGYVSDIVNRRERVFKMPSAA